VGRFGSQMIKRSVIWGVLLVFLGIGLWGCGDRSPDSLQQSSRSPLTQSRRIAEVAPPAIFQDLRQTLDSYQPQVEILSPRSGAVMEDDQVTVKFQVRDLPVFKDEDLGLGPYLQVYLDDQPYQAVYDANQTLIFQGLMPGTHTIRAIAARPWHETYKNEGAFASVTFHIFTKTPKNDPDPARPLITYSRPQSTVGAEPMMLDFYLTNVPLHLIAQERSDDEIKDWRIKCTVNGESFIFDEWRPIYLKGLKPGKNWVQLELLDEDGLPTENAFNNTVRLIIYEPGAQDTLSRLVRGEIPVNEALAITDPNYVPEPPAPVPGSMEEPSPTPFPEALEPKAEEPSPTPAPEAIEPEAEEESQPSPEPAPVDSPEEDNPIPADSATPEPEMIPEPEASPTPVPTPSASEALEPESALDDQEDNPQEEQPEAREVAPDVAPLETPEPIAPEVEPSEPEAIQPSPTVTEPEVEPPTLEAPKADDEVPETVEPTEPVSPDVIRDLPIVPLPEEAPAPQTPSQRFKSRFQGMRDRLSDTLKQRQEKGRSPQSIPQITPEPTAPSPTPIPESPIEITPEIAPEIPDSPEFADPQAADVIPDLNPDPVPPSSPAPPSAPPIGSTPWV